jgi:hypothetical protein
MPELTITLSQLRGMIGQCVVYQGQMCWVIEVIEEQTALVLQIAVEKNTIQPNQFGEAHRRASEIITLPVLTADRRSLHLDFLELDLL